MLHISVTSKYLKQEYIFGQNRIYIWPDTPCTHKNKEKQTNETFEHWTKKNKVNYIFENHTKMKNKLNNKRTLSCIHTDISGKIAKRSNEQKKQLIKIIYLL